MSLITIKREIICHDLDIVPIGIRVENADSTAAAALAHMSPEDARRMKRKFRKLWRSAAKKLKHSYKRKMGLGVREPTPKHKSERTILVSGLVFQKTYEKFGKEC